MTEENNIDNASQEELISIYVYTLREEKGENPEDAEAHVALERQVTAAVNDAIIDALPDDKAEEMNKLFEQNEATPEKIAEIVANSGIDTQAITEEALDKFRADYLGENDERHDEDLNEHNDDDLDEEAKEEE